MYSNRASDILHLVKVTMYNQNNNIQFFFYILNEQKSPKSG